MGVALIEEAILDSKLDRKHPTFKRLRALRRDAKLRRDEGVFVAEGMHLTGEALAACADIEQVLYSERLTRSDEGQALLERLKSHKIRLIEVAPAALDSIQDARSPQPVLAVVRRFDATLEGCIGNAGGEPLVVVAHGIQDPGNLGTLLRTADAAGAAVFVISGESADLYHPRTIRGTMGSVFRLPTVVADQPTATEAFRSGGLAIVATVPAAPEATDFRQTELGGGCAIFFGGEGAGLPRSVLESARTLASIPMRTGVESLSVGAAAAIVLFEAARQREAGERTAS
jgi:TrmH family RNA methyltransferase